MNDIEKEEDKLQMLEMIRDFGWITEVNETSPYEDVEEEFNNMNMEKEAIGDDLGLDQED